MHNFSLREIDSVCTGRGIEEASRIDIKVYSQSEVFTGFRLAARAWLSGCGESWLGERDERRGMIS